MKLKLGVCSYIFPFLFKTETGYLQLVRISRFCENQSEGCAFELACLEQHVLSALHVHVDTRQVGEKVMFECLFLKVT